MGNTDCPDSLDVTEKNTVKESQLKNQTKLLLPKMQTLYYGKCMLWDLHIYKSIFSQSPNFWGTKKN